MQFATFLWERGANVLAIENGKKKPVGEWKRWMEERQQKADVSALPWHDADRVGIVNGINGIRSFDIDKNSGPTILERVLSKLGLPADYQWVETSQSGSGWHIWFACYVNKLDDFPNIPDDAPGVFVGAIPGGGQLELRWERNQTICAASANPALWRNGVPTGEIAVIDNPALITSAFLSSAIPKDRKSRPTKFVSGDSNRPGDDFNSRGNLVPHLEDAGWQFVDRSGEVEYWRRPGKTDGGASATLNYYPGLFYVFSSNAQPFEANEAYSLFAAYAILKHGGNWKDAATQLAAEGYGASGLTNLKDEEIKFLQMARHSDLGNAECFTYLNRNDYRYDHTKKRWYTWDGIIWREDNRNAAQHAMLRVIRARGEAAWQVSDDARRQELSRWSLKSESSAHYREALERVKVIPDISTVTTDYDRNNYLVGMKNGILDLVTGDFFNDGRREELMTTQTNVIYNREADAPLWAKTVNEIFGGDKDLITYVQKALGMCLSGDITEQAFFICYGSGANGKSLMLNTVRRVIGDYGTTTSFQTFDADNRNEYGNDMAELKGRRFVIAIEAEQNRKLAEARIKTITGGDQISCRFLYGQLFTYNPSYKVWLAVNHKPQVRGADHGIWRRLHLIPFNVRFGSENHPRNTHLEVELETEYSGIFNWLLEGYNLWKAEGLNPPESVILATKEYKAENDAVSRWIDEECVMNTDAKMGASDAYQAFRTWMEEQGESARFVPNMTIWGQRMSEKAFEKGRDGKGRLEYRGIGLKGPGPLGSKGV